MNIKPRFWIIVGGIFLLIVIVAVLASSGTPPAQSNPDPTPTPYMPTETVEITIENNIGVKSITIYNQNTGQSYVASVIDLPYSFNCTRNDYIRFTVVVQDGYRWNAWTFKPMGIPVSVNPAVIRASENNIYGNLMIDGRIVMTPNCQPLDSDTPISEGD